jgi:hypothetical protein
MITKRQYIEYLISTPANYTCTNLAKHLQGVSHDAISDYLAQSKITAHQLWELVQPLVRETDSETAYLIIDDSVQDKRYSNQIELVKKQYSGAEGGLVRGIGVVNLLHTDGVGGNYYPIDYRNYAPQQDGKTKNEHFRDMLIGAVSAKGIRAKRVLFDSWYGSVDNLKLVVRLGMVFVTTLKSNRLVSLSKEGGYIHLDQLEWGEGSEEQLRYGMVVKLKELPFKVRLFKVVATNGDIEWVITNSDRPDEATTHSVQEENEVRWQVEQFHRELKQLTGTEACQCRKARSQRNHIACCYHAWLSLKVAAVRLGKSLYRAQADLLSDYLRAQLRNPSITAFGLP